jgi:hypothetical protein
MDHLFIGEEAIVVPATGGVIYGGWGSAAVRLPETRRSF